MRFYEILHYVQYDILRFYEILHYVQYDILRFYEILHYVQYDILRFYEILHYVQYDINYEHYGVVNYKDEQTVRSILVVVLSYLVQSHALH
ncbi:hypothetical protein CAL7716_055170 [Calothrix sp. PCC 7716]|nr:hypothetical protein CAL7716_055170 [Calothrix sp. PCC 7716]